jgi:hypothetical protein
MTTFCIVFYESYLYTMAASHLEGPVSEEAEAVLEQSERIEY